jgi:DUF5010 C-terminal domain
MHRLFLPHVIASIALVLVMQSSIGNAADAPPVTNHIPAEYVGKPETALPQIIPGTVAAVDYDEAPAGANEMTFSYHGKPVQTKFRKGPDSIGIAGFGKGHVSTTGTPEDPTQAYVGWTHGGEWLKYTVSVTEAGTYVIGAKVSAGAKGATLAFSFAPDLTTGEIEIPTTAGFQPGVEVYHVWEKLDNLKEITLPAGTFVMTVKIGKIAGLNLHSFTFTKKQEVVRPHGN